MEFLTGLGIGILGILVTIGIAVYQARSPVITVECRPISDGDPAALDCEVHNSGKREARDVHVGFNKMLPLGTSVFAEPEIGAELLEAKLPPDPNVSPNVAGLTRAFAVRIPRVPPKTSVKFQVRTVDSDNKRAAKQVLRLRGEIKIVLRAFGERLSAVHPKDAQAWNLEALMSARVKQESFFTPGHFVYEKGRFPVLFLTEEEQRAVAVDQDLYARYKKEFIDIYQGRAKFKAPVVRLKTSEGVRTYATFPPYVSTYLEEVVSMKALREQGRVTLYPSVPSSYD